MLAKDLTKKTSTVGGFNFSSSRSSTEDQAAGLVSFIPTTTNKTHSFWLVLHLLATK